MHSTVRSFCVHGITYSNFLFGSVGNGKWVVVGMADCSVIAFCCGPSSSSAGSSSWGMPMGLAA